MTPTPLLSTLLLLAAACRCSLLITAFYSCAEQEKPLDAPCSLTRCSSDRIPVPFALSTLSPNMHKSHHYFAATYYIGLGNI